MFKYDSKLVVTDSNGAIIAEEILLDGLTLIDTTDDAVTLEFFKEGNRDSVFWERTKKCNLQQNKVTLEKFIKLEQENKELKTALQKVKTDANVLELARRCGIVNDDCYRSLLRDVPNYFKKETE